MPDFEQMLEDYYCEVLSPGDACIDVGAHVGRHTFPLARCVGSSGKVFAFEPIPAIAAQLRAAIKAELDHHEIELRECALADTNGEVDFVLVREAPGYSGLLPRHYDSEVTTEIIRVNVQRLDDLASCLPPIRFIKIDCEGAELRVMRGAKKLLKRDRPIISFECGDASLESYNYDAGDIFDFLDGVGYAIRSIHRDSLDRGHFIMSCARQEYWDYIAIPKLLGISEM
ncbi:MAG: FkbM family methyltransferase [Terriglobales bacterium]